MSELKRKYDGLKGAHKELSVEVVSIRTRLALAEMVVEAWEHAIKSVRGYYPESIFPPDSDSVDAQSGTFARLVCDNIVREKGDALTAYEGVPDADKD